MPEPLLHIEIVGLRDVQGRFQRAARALQEAQRDEMRTLGRKVVRALQEEAPVRTGALRKGITFKTYQVAQETRLHITSQQPYTKYVVQGRGPVVARRAKALRFQPTLHGPFIFRKRVGPAKPNPFQARALAKLGDEPISTARRIARYIQSAYAYGPGPSPLAS